MTLQISTKGQLKKKGGGNNVIIYHDLGQKKEKQNLGDRNVTVYWLTKFLRSCTGRVVTSLLIYCFTFTKKTIPFQWEYNLTIFKRFKTTLMFKQLFMQMSPLWHLQLLTIKNILWAWNSCSHKLQRINVFHCRCFPHIDSKQLLTLMKLIDRKRK